MVRDFATVNLNSNRSSVQHGANLAWNADGLVGRNLWAEIHQSSSPDAVDC